MTHHIITQVKESLGGVEKGLGVLRGVEKGLGVLRGIFGVLRRIEGHLVRGIEGHLVGGIEGYLVGGNWGAPGGEEGEGGSLVERRGRLEGDGSLDCQKHCLKNKNKKNG